MIKTNKHAKIEYQYESYYMSEFKSIFQFIKILPIDVNVVNVQKGKRYKDYTVLYCGFDIETTTTESNNGFMYIWQFSINNMVIKGRTWEEFKTLLKYIEQYFELKSSNRIIVWVANLSFEWQFIRKHLIVTEYFMKTKRDILTFTHDDCIEFRECLSISGGSLSYLAKTFTNTQKCVDDLDYSVMRNSMTELTELEESYCENDVLVLSEWSKYIFDTYIIPSGFVPLTIQSVIRRDIERNCRGWWLESHDTCKNLNLAISSQFPTESVYKHMMTYLFRGGYVHGRMDYVGMLMNHKYNIGSVDFTSSYPATMEHCYMPSAFYTHYYDNNIDEYMRDITKYCVIANITFTNIRPNTMHSIESKSKCIRLSSDAIIDNGRVRCATEMTVCLTELDFRIYQKFYEWDSMTIHSAMRSKRLQHLPAYVLKGMEENYTKKSVLKSLGENYSVPKQIVNSYYGVCVQKLVELNTIYDTESMSAETEQAKPYNDQIANKRLLPMWGIYITAHSRYNLLNVCYSIEKAGGTVLYMDTDSLKIVDFDNYKYIIDLYNNRQMKKNQLMCQRRGLDYNIFYDLGCLDYEGRIFEMKYYGAKRYVTTMFDSKKKGLTIHQTIAGLPKTTLIDKYKTRSEVYSHFKNKMRVIESDKLTTHYNDDEVSEYITDEQGNTVLMTELSNIGLSETDFNMSIDEFWLNIIQTMQEKEMYLEKR